MSDKKYLFISSIIMCSIILFIYYSFPSSHACSLNEIPSKISYQRSIYEGIKLNEIFYKNNDNFIKTMIMHKYGLTNQMHKIRIKDSRINIKDSMRVYSTNIFINEYNIIINENKIYSLNENIVYKIDNDSIHITDILPNKSEISYKIPLNYPDYIYIKDTQGIYEIGISKELIIFPYFYLLDFVASLSAS